MLDNETTTPDNETSTPGTIADTPPLDEVAVGSALVTGAVFVAPTSVPLPTDATTQLDAAYKMLSFTDDAGVTISESSNKKDIRVWEGKSRARTIRSARAETIKFKPVNINQRVAEVTWGKDAVDVDAETGAMSIGHHGNPVEPVHIVIETVPFAGAVRRRCAKVSVGDLGDETLNGEDSEGRDLTFDCLMMDDGFTLHEYIAYVD